MRSHRTAALAATLSLATGLVAVDIPWTAVAAHADTYAPPTSDELAALRYCESSGDYGANTGNGYYGGYQFSPQTWSSLGYSGYANQASPATQDEAVVRLHASSGWAPWPGCSRSLGLTSHPAGAAAEAPVAAAAVSTPVAVEETVSARQIERDQRSIDRAREREQRSIDRASEREQRLAQRRRDRAARGSDAG